jgi:lipopolysaccharide/colanic/teichoic acid biosynthesis glycosyltransferase
MHRSVATAQTAREPVVGRRLLRLEYLLRNDTEQARRHEIRLGITGSAQVHGRRHVPMSERFALGTWYVDHWSLGLDLPILLRTIQRVVGGCGVGPPATDEPDRFQSLAGVEGSAPGSHVP